MENIEIIKSKIKSYKKTKKILLLIKILIKSEFFKNIEEEEFASCRLETLKEISEILGKYINHPNKYGNTILHIICESCPSHNRQIQFLIEKSKINLLLKNKDGKTALDIYLKKCPNNSYCEKTLVLLLKKTREKNFYY